MTALIRKPVFLFILVLLVTLFFGLRPKGYSFINQAKWFEDRNGIYFEKYGIIHSENELQKLTIFDEINIVMALRPYHIDKKLSKIITIIDKKNKEILAVEQWTDELMVTVYSSKMRTSVLGFSGALSKDTTRSAFISVNRESISISIDSVTKNRRHRFLLPEDFLKEGRLIVGASAEGRNPWQGEISYLAIFNSFMPDTIRDKLLLNATQLLNEFQSGFRPTALFTFKTEEGTTISDRSGNSWNLTKPVLTRVFRKIYLKCIPEFDRPGSFLSDTIINFLGFIPLGIICHIMLTQFIRKGKRSLFLTTLVCFFISLGIELVQVYIPTRTSQLPDIILNSAGAYVGAIMAGSRLLPRWLMEKMCTVYVKTNKNT